MIQMKRRMLPILAATLLIGCAAADGITVDGTISADKTTRVFAPIGGTVEQVEAEVGETVTADSVLLTLRTTKAYATEEGKVTGVFGQPGDAITTVTERYGAVLYIEGDKLYTVAGSTTNAYNETDTKMVHVGEKVYMVCRTANKRTGTGVITAVSGTDYTVEVDSGNFIPGDSVNIYRGDAVDAKLLLGRGDVSRRSPTAVTGEGSLVRLHVQDGDTVKRGDLLFETLTGSFDGLWMSGETFTAGTAGTLGSLNAEAGAQVQKDAVIAVIYDASSMRVEAELPEGDLQQLKAGDTVQVTADSDESLTAQGTVRRISAIATAGDGNSEKTYTVIVDFEPAEGFRYGMSVVVSKE